MNPCYGDINLRDVCGGGFMSEKAFVKPFDTYKLDNNVYLKSGPRLHIAFKPEEVKVGIVKCGGICPGKIFLLLKNNFLIRFKCRYQRDINVFMVQLRC